jgi:hypothetical protein
MLTVDTYRDSVLYMVSERTAVKKSRRGVGKNEPKSLDDQGVDNMNAPIGRETTASKQVQGKK